MNRKFLYEIKTSDGRWIQVSGLIYDMWKGIKRSSSSWL